MQVLVADDDDPSRLLLSAQLRRLGHNVIAVSDGFAALEALNSPTPPQVAILDWIMPGTDGPSLCRAVRAQVRDRYVYIILVTAKNRPEELVEGLDSGADDYISKPVFPDELRARLRVGQRIIALQDDLIRAREQLRVQATHDDLTGLWNRGAIINALRKECVRCAQEQYALGVLICDVDHFKNINDTHGHPAGDQVLRIVAERIARAVRQTDYVGRYGGEEFLLVLPDCTEGMLSTIAERVRTAVCEDDIAGHGFRLKVSISVGASVQRSGQLSSPELLLSSADSALFAAKRAGRNRVVTADLPLPTVEN